jgi:hypothetical protein
MIGQDGLYRDRAEDVVPKYLILSGTNSNIIDYLDKLLLQRVKVRMLETGFVIHKLGFPRNVSVYQSVKWRKVSK